MNAILVNLNITQEQYEFEVLDIFLRWSMDFATNYENDLQKIVQNAPVFNYFKTEFAKCEREFLNIMKEYENQPNIKPKDVKEAFNRSTISIFNKYPKSLIINAKKPIIIAYDIAAN
ncbi:hypothetical protein JJC03_15640 [Flavobacterium oreochromis]|uniref:hypothetical protein n=1 Tax=Flavobacterium oreochromis TaxID=2906078 RepID=UPI001CE6EC66|nr:hypothetical protein [Flavobacterium oreochromis]QYS86332.1 hypothetical protein JJC03_15640 [Flavobacterium oreochromis]